MTEKHPAQLLFSDKHPLTSILNMEFKGVVDRVLTVSVTAPESFADSDGIHVHTGFNTLFLDTIMGACAIGELKQYIPIATVKLNCTHLGRMKIGESVICRAKHQGEVNDMAYISAEIHSENNEELIATAIGTFMIGTASKPLAVKA